MLSCRTTCTGLSVRLGTACKRKGQPRRLATDLLHVESELNEVFHFQAFGITFPRTGELFLYKGCVVLAVLFQQRLMQAVEGSWISRVVLEIRAEDFLGPFGVAVHQHHASECFAHGIEPVGRLVVLELVLSGDGLVQKSDGGL